MLLFSACATVYLKTCMVLAFLPVRCQGQEDVKFDCIGGCEIRLYRSLINSVSCTFGKLELKKKKKKQEGHLSFVFSYSPTVLKSMPCSKSQP